MDDIGAFYERKRQTQLQKAGELSAARAVLNAMRPTDKGWGAQLKKCAKLHAEMLDAGDCGD